MNRYEIRTAAGRPVASIASTRGVTAVLDRTKGLAEVYEVDTLGRRIGTGAHAETGYDPLAPADLVLVRMDTAWKVLATTPITEQGTAPESATIMERRGKR